MLNLVEMLQRSGVIGLGLCWTFFSHRIQSLKARVHPLWEYTDHSNPTRESEEELALSKVVARVADMLAVDDAASMFDGHPSPRSLAHCPPNVSLPTLFAFVELIVDLLPYPTFCVIAALGRIAFLPAPPRGQGEEEVYCRRGSQKEEEGAEEG
ncbi:hypothetical protein BAE44_0017020 [Dichanthelium oligosanthes]|uniref:Uncharacterized protein n=1 Tax=Dichanthelium oligosanthes TaxID=888268 RepID=A0A1E5VA32_9POAL|nr:hypothetical protein BAE44_0017020 [Dichanthelium oligosanthes]